MSSEGYTRSGDELVQVYEDIWTVCPVCGEMELIIGLRYGMCHECGCEFDVAATVELMERKGDSR